MSKSTLSSVVSNLVRASMGSSVSSSVTDEDLDKHVADLILKEAKQKAESYAQLGIKAYLPTGPDPNAPRPNKRFLSSIIRSTDDHNKTIIRAQALAAQEIKREKEEQARRERRARAEEAVAAERSRRRRRDDSEWGDDWHRPRDSGRSSRARDWDKDWRSYQKSKQGEDGYAEEREKKRSRREHRSRSRSKERDRDKDREHRHRKSRKRTSSVDRERVSHRSERSQRKHRRSDGHERHRERDHKRRRDAGPSVSPHRSPTPVQSEPPCKRSCSISPSEDDHADHDRTKAIRHRTPSPSRSSETLQEENATATEPRRTAKGKQKDPDPVTDSSTPPTLPVTRSPSPPPPPPSRRSRTRNRISSVRSPSVSPPPLPPSALPSKMDKYFEDSYDPRLDVTPLSIPTVPDTGLINDSEYAGWDAMLELLRQRREDKEERKRLEKLGFEFGDKKIPGPKLTTSKADASVNLMGIEYNKRGSVREWDLGKEGF
ncbi:hypothetical protein F5I97DRAFT_1879286 [Phlebopus sp. FC_14]|nr:hypothetical protein F5I97DRAFT_1879286 [Phlebopus sp. FC_14]